MKIAIFWHRRDIRFADNAGLYHALKGDEPVLPLFIFDRNILDELEDKRDRRVEFIHNYIQQLSARYAEAGGALLVKYGKPEEVFEALLSDFDIAAVYTNRDYEPYGKARDAAIETLLGKHGIPLHTYKDQCIFEKGEVLKNDGGPYTVFTPYSRKWYEKLDIDRSDEHVRSYPTEDHAGNLWKSKEKFPIPSLEDMGFEACGQPFPDRKVSVDILKNYEQNRNFPAMENSTTRLSVHLRFGTVSIRQLAQRGLKHSGKWLNELVWRDFYMMILHHFPHVVNQNFNSKYDAVQWRQSESDFKAWCEGQTGYPIVDAGMRELNETGFMHNRVRMITASFLTKHLLIDWRWGEAYFAKKLLDFELSSNNGGWQWAAGTGTDAQPYFRIFNPYSQTEKFDKNEQYIKRWVPEYKTSKYPKPIVAHKAARERCLDAFKSALGKD